MAFPSSCRSERGLSPPPTRRPAPGGHPHFFLDGSTRFPVRGAPCCLPMAADERLPRDAAAAAAAAAPGLRASCLLQPCRCKRSSLTAGKVHRCTACATCCRRADAVSNFRQSPDRRTPPRSRAPGAPVARRHRPSRPSPTLRRPPPARRPISCPPASYPRLINLTGMLGEARREKR